MIDGMIGIRRMKVGLENDVEKGLEGRETPAQQMLVGRIGRNIECKGMRL
jgi:hypothetical protein